MITLKELLSGHNVADIPITHQQNLEELLKRINVIRQAWGNPMTVTSSYRSMQDHLRIYSEKMGKNYDVKKVPMQSNHLYGRAVDFSDPKLELTAWLKSKEGAELLESTNLFCEDGNKNWVHFQTKPFGSYKPGGTRWFKP